MFSLESKSLRWPYPEHPTWVLAHLGRSEHYDTGMWPCSERASFTGWGEFSPLIIPPCPLCTVTAKICARYRQWQCYGQLPPWKRAETLWNRIKNHAAIQVLTWEVSKTFPLWLDEDEPHRWGIPKPLGYALTPAGSAFFVSHLLPPILPWHYWNGSKVFEHSKERVLFCFPPGAPKVMKNAGFVGEGERGSKSLHRPNLFVSPLKLRVRAAVENCNCLFHTWLNIVKYQVLSSRGQLNVISFRSAYMHRGSLSPLSSGFFILKRNKSTLYSIF